MQTRTRNPFTTIHTEGALLPSDLLQRVLDYDKGLPGLTPEGYHLSGEKLNEAINRSWNRLQGAWAAFQTARGRLAQGEAGTTLTRERWLYPLFDELDFGRLQAARGLELDGKAYAISHLWANVPLHLLGCGVDLEKRSAGVVGASTSSTRGSGKASPHSLLQEYLNRSADAQWGMVTNGLRLRVLRDNASLTRQAFLEFDLEAMFEGEVYADFALLWLICHQSRFEMLEANHKDTKSTKSALSQAENQNDLVPLVPSWLNDCILEQWSKSAQEQGTRALTKLRAGVEQAIAALGAGFLKAQSNQALRADLRSGALASQDYYRQLLRLVYRLIFLFVAEDRGLLFDPASTPPARERYLKYYSLQRLRRLAARTRGSRHPDLYEALKVVMDILAGKTINHEDTKTTKAGPGDQENQRDLASFASLPRMGWAGLRLNLGLPVLGGFLFSDAALPDLDGASLENEALLTALRHLTQIDEGNTRRAVDYRNLGSEELGGIYESLLELHPQINTDSATFELASVAGNERKETGSYYTPTSLIQVLLDSALDPVIEQALERANSLTTKDTKFTKGEKENQGSSSWSLVPFVVKKQEEALLNLKIIDPACGSGHFLVAAAHRLAKRLAFVRTGEGEPAPDAMRTALREVISHCIYGVDINPMSVELCKVSLWMEALEPGKPLSFLDAHIQCGNSLVGVGPVLNHKDTETTKDSFSASENKKNLVPFVPSWFDLLEIPDEAFNAVTGDHKPTAALLKKRNKQERAGQESLFVTVLKTQEDLDAWLAERAHEVEVMSEDSPEQVQAKADAYLQMNGSVQFQKQKQLADMWTAAFFWQIREPKGTALEIAAPTQGQLRRLRAGSPTQPGLLVEVKRLSQANTFFHWPLAFPDVHRQGGFDCVLGNPPWERIKLQEEEFFAQRDAQIAGAINKAVRQKLIDSLPQTNPLLADEFATARHAAECSSKFVRFSERFPLTAVGDVNTYALFAEHFRALAGVGGRAGIIVPTGIATDDSTKDFFGDLVEKRAIASLFDFENREKLFPAVDSRMKFSLLTISTAPVKASQFVFFATRTAHLQDAQRRFSLAPQEIALFNPNTRTMPVFRSRADAELTRSIYNRIPILINEGLNHNHWNLQVRQGLFHLTNDLRDNFVLDKSVSQVPDDYISIYEAKLIWLYDHHFASYHIVGTENPIEIPLEQKKNPKDNVIGRYYVSDLNLQLRIPEKYKWSWFIAYRDVTNATNERTAIATVLPRYGVAYTLRVVTGFSANPNEITCFLANFNSVIFDYIVRQAVSGMHMSDHIVKQLPVLPPEAYSPADIAFIAPRVLELTYTAYDLEPFARDMLAEIGVETWNEWFAHNPLSPGFSPLATPHAPLPAFRWDEARRAMLRAELDAYYARLYGLNHKQLRYILDPADLTARELEDILDPREQVSDALDPAGYEARRAASTFPGETFRVLKDKEMRLYGEYRTRRLVLEAWDRLEDQGLGNREWGVGSSPYSPLPTAQNRSIEHQEQNHGSFNDTVISGSESVAGSDEPGRNVLPADQSLSKRGSLRHDQPDTPGGGIGAGQYRPGFSQGSGDPSTPRSEGRSDHKGSSGAAVKPGGNDRQDSSRSDQGLAEEHGVGEPAVVNGELGVEKAVNSPTPSAGSATQPSFSDFGLYECSACGKRVLGFDQGRHVQEAHPGKAVAWKRVR